MITLFKKKAVDPVVAFQLPNLQHLQLLHAKYGEHAPDISVCYELLFVTQYGSMTVYCPQCGLRSVFSLTDTGTKAGPVFQCGYSFCGYLLPLAIPFMSLQSKATLQQWLKVWMLVSEDSNVAMDRVAKGANVSWASAREMRKRLQSVSEL